MAETSCDRCGSLVGYVLCDPCQADLGPDADVALLRWLHADRPFAADNLLFGAAKRGEVRWIFNAVARGFGYTAADVYDLAVYAVRTDHWRSTLEWADRVAAAWSAVALVLADQAAAEALGLKYYTFCARVSRARAHFLQLWHEGEVPSTTWGNDRRRGRETGRTAIRVLAHRHRCRRYAAKPALWAEGGEPDAQ